MISAATGAGFELTNLLPDGFLSDASVVGLVLLFGWLVATGRLVTRREVDSILQDRDYWRNAFFAQQEQSQQLMETGRVARDVLRALPVPQKGEADGS